MNEVVRALKALQIADNKDVAMPENWPNNELIGKKVIVPPPKDIKGAGERSKVAEGYDWWFTFRDI